MGLDHRHDLLADAEALDPGASGLAAAGGSDAGHGGGRLVGAPHLAQQDVGRVDGGRPDRDPHLPFARRGNLAVDDADDLETAWPVERHGSGGQRFSWFTIRHEDTFQGRPTQLRHGACGGVIT